MANETEKYKSVSAKLQKFGQSHLLSHLPQLSEDEAASYLKRLDDINYETVKTMYEQFQQGQQNSKLDELMQPVPSCSIGSAVHSADDEKQQWEHEGLLRISESKVAVVLLAGGQGTRLGVKYPKGMYSVGLASGKTLYQIKAERIKRLQDLAFQRTGKNGVISWYIMTSEATMAQTKDFFASHNYFGLDSSNVIFFEQFTLPCMDFEGKILLSSKGKVSTSPDGNGGLYNALVRRDVLDDMEKRGVESIHVLCVDNILARIADPAFIGFCKLNSADCGAKVVEKSKPEEAVGVVCQVNGVYQVVEYSEISEETSKKRDSNGRLVYNAGNICNHYFTRAFLRKVCSEELPLHIAKKKIPYMNDAGEIIKPTTPNGIKMEKFVFDVFKFSEKFVVFDVPREDEFSPLKNAEGASSCTPRHARWALASLHHRRIVAAGGEICDASGKVVAPLSGMDTHVGEYPVDVEISPLVAYDGEDLEQLVSGKTLQSPVHLNPTSDADKIVLNGN